MDSFADSLVSLSELRACEVDKLNFHHVSFGPLQIYECAHSHEQFHAAARGHGQLGSECDQLKTEKKTRPRTHGRVS